MTRRSVKEERDPRRVAEVERFRTKDPTDIDRGRDKPFGLRDLFIHFIPSSQ